MFDIFTKEGLLSFIYTLPALLASLSIHEYAHAWVAYKLGDISQKIRGRLTLDPFKHIDPIGFLCIALCGFGWGRPVMIDDRNFKDRAKGTMLTALAGPVSNLLLAIFLTVVFKILLMTGVVQMTATSKVAQILTSMLLMTIEFNVVFAVFNMIPIPPFDGSKVLFYFLPGRTKSIMYTLEKYSFIIILIMLMTNLVDVIINPIYQLIAKFLMFIINL